MHSLPALTREQSRQVDQIAMDEYGISGVVLMENAGRGITDRLGEKLGSHTPRRVLIACGKGNNAGDGFVIARHLAIRGHRPTVALWSDPAKLRGDAAENFAIVSKMDVPVVVFGDEHDPARLAALLDEADWVVDALLGTGVTGAPRPPLDGVIEQINAAGCPVLAVDVPSGLDCDSGAPSEHTVRAAVTCTMVTPKQGFTATAAGPYVGELHVVDIGIPPGIVARIAGG